MRKLDKYLIGKFLGTYFFSIVLIISIAVVFDFNDNVDHFSETHAPWREIVFTYYLNFIPFYTNLFSSLFVFISVIFFTTKLADNSEFIAMISAGVSFKRLWVPYMAAAAVIAAINFYLGSEIIPRGSVKRLEFEDVYKKKRRNPTYAENVQLQVDTGIIAYMEHFDGQSKTGYHFSLDRFENKKLISHLTAQRARYDTLSDRRFQWQLTNVQVRSLRGLREKITNFSNVDTIIPMEPRDFLFIAHQHQTMTNGELSEYIERQRIRGIPGLTEFEVEYHKRYASPMAAFILATIGMSLSARKRKGGMGAALGVGIALSASYIMLQTLCTSFATQGGVNPILAAWMPNIIYICIAYYLFRKAPN